MEDIAEKPIAEDNAPSLEARDIAQQLLLPGEKVVQIAAISPGIYWHGIAVACFAVIAIFYGIWLALYILVVAGALLLMSYSTQKYLVLMTTDHRVIARFGVLNQQVFQLRFQQLESVDVITTLPGQILGYGSVLLTGAGRLRLIIPYVRDAASFRDHLTQRLMQPEPAVPVAPEAVAAAPTPVPVHALTPSTATVTVAQDGTLV